jgi:hypothetical protein
MRGRFSPQGAGLSCGVSHMDEITEAVQVERARVLDILIEGLPAGMYSNGWVHSIIQKIEAEQIGETK